MPRKSPHDYEPSEKPNAFASTFTVCVLPGNVPAEEVDAHIAALRESGVEVFRDRNVDVGHAWIEYEPFDRQSGDPERRGNPETYGTYQDTGLCIDRERSRGNDPLAERPDVVRRTYYLVGEAGDEKTGQEDLLVEALAKWKDKGQGAWSTEHPCSSFVAQITRDVTGERLHDRTPQGISSPAVLAESVRAANEKSLEAEQRSVREERLNNTV